MVHHFLSTNPYKISISEMSVTCSSFFQELHSHIDKNSGKKFEDMFLVKIANKGTFLSISVDDRQGAHLMLLKIDENYNAIALANSRSGCVFEV